MLIFDVIEFRCVLYTNKVFSSKRNEKRGVAHYTRDFTKNSLVSIEKKDKIVDSCDPRRIEKVKQFRYLGCVIIEDLLPEIKIKHRIG